MAEVQPMGIRQLIDLNRLVVRQKSSMAFKNKYTVLSPDRQELLYAKESSGLLNAMLGGKNRSFNIDMLDTENTEVITLRRPYTFGPDKMDVTVCNQLASVVRQEVTFLKPVLSINDASDKPVLRVKGPIGQGGECDYDIFTMEKKRIGVIRKKWGGLLREMFTDGDNFEIEFPGDLDVRYKAAIIGTCLLIDFLYYEH